MDLTKRYYDKFIKRIGNNDVDFEIFRKNFNAHTIECYCTYHRTYELFVDWYKNNEEFSDLQELFRRIFDVNEQFSIGARYIFLLKLVHGKIYKTKHKLAIEGVNEFINTSETIMNTLKNAKSYLEESSRFLKMSDEDILKLERIQVSKSLRAMRDNRED